MTHRLLRLQIAGRRSGQGAKARPQLLRHILPVQHRSHPPSGAPVIVSPQRRRGRKRLYGWSACLAYIIIVLSRLSLSRESGNPVGLSCNHRRADLAGEVDRDVEFAGVDPTRHLSPETRTLPAMGFSDPALPAVFPISART